MSHPQCPIAGHHDPHSFPTNDGFPGVCVCSGTDKDDACPTCKGSALAALCGRTDAGSDGPCVMRAGHDVSPCWGENDVASDWQPAVPCLACCVCPCGSTSDGTECPWCHVSMTPGRLTRSVTP